MNAEAVRRIWAYGFSAVVLIAVLLPVFGDPRSDSFPLSTYPMFSGRQSPNVNIAHVIGFTSAGERVILPPDAVGNDEVVQAFETSRRAAAAGAEESLALCMDAAQWASEHRRDAVTFALITDSFDAIQYFDGETEPRNTFVHAECRLAR